MASPSPKAEIVKLFPEVNGMGWMATGRNRGMFGTDADDQAVAFTGIAIGEVRDGKLAHNWVERSAYEL